MRGVVGVPGGGGMVQRYPSSEKSTNEIVDISAMQELTNDSQFMY